MAALTTSLTITNSTEELDQVRAMVRDGILKGGFPPRLLNRVTIAVDEAVTNIVEHAFPDVAKGKGTIQIEQSVTPEEYRVTMVDDGMLHYDPRKHSTVDIQEHVDAGHDSGLGIFLIRRIMDTVEYAYEKGSRNRLTLVKRAE